jgi:hypothetical protein
VKPTRAAFLELLRREYPTAAATPWARGLAVTADPDQAAALQEAASRVGLQVHLVDAAGGRVQFEISSFRRSRKPIATWAQGIGARLARRIFEQRGNHTEAHLSERELAAYLGLAAQLGTRRTDGK